MRWLYLYWTILLRLTTDVVTLSIRDIFENSRLSFLRKGGAPNPSSNFMSDIFDPFYTSYNIRGGNSKFEYIPRNNYRQVSIYQISQFEGHSKDEILEKLSHILHKRIQKRNAVPKKVQNIEDLEIAGIKKGIFTLCKWAVPIPSYPIGKLEQCTEAELKSVVHVHQN